MFWIECNVYIRYQIHWHEQAYEHVEVTHGIEYRQYDGIHVPSAWYLVNCAIATLAQLHIFSMSATKSSGS